MKKICQETKKAQYERITNITFWSATDETKKGIYRGILNSEVDGTYPRSPYKFFFKEENMWIAVDNSDNSCFVEEFNTLEEAISWLNNEISS